MSRSNWITPVIVFGIGSASIANAEGSVTQVALPESEQSIYWQTLAVTDPNTLWLGSTQGHIAHSTDGGGSWSISRPTGTAEIAITQLKTIDGRQAYALTSGRGSNSRLYHTRNSGFSWNRVHRADGNESLRCFDLITDGEAWILGNSVNNNWHVVRSANGRTWLGARSGFNQDAQEGEGAFNDSASCVRHVNDTWAMGSAYAERGRIMFKSTSALRFRVEDTPIEGEQAAVTAVWPLGHQDILFTGGDLSNDAEDARVYRFRNGSVETLPSTPLNGVLTNLKIYQNTLVTANQHGIAWSRDWGENWEHIAQPARQLRCTEEHGCYALYDDQLIHFVPETD